MYLRTSEAERRLLYDLRNNCSRNALALDSGSDADDPDQGGDDQGFPDGPPVMKVASRTLPILSLGKHAAGWINKLDALVFCLLLEVPAVSDNPMDDIIAYSHRVICNVSDQGLDYDQSLAVDIAALVADTAADLGGEDVQPQPKHNEVISLLDSDDDNIGAPGDQPTSSLSQHGDLVVLEEKEEGEVEVEDDVGFAKLFPNSIQTSDLKHTMDNILAEILQCLAFWPDLHTNLGALETLLKRATYRERFVYSCMGEKATKAERRLFQTWNKSIKSLRWECLVDFVTELSLVEKPLRKYWSLNKFKTGGGDRFKALREENASILHTADAAISSESFWIQAALLGTLAFEAEFIGRWAEGCSCCGLDLDKAKTCPFRGCRAVELASNEWKLLLTREMRLRGHTISQALASSEDTERAVLIDDIGRARTKLWALLEVKLHYFQELPWRLCALVEPGALAHSDPFIATTAAVDCLAMFDHQQTHKTSSTAQSLHAQTKRFLDPKWRGLPDGPCEEPLRPLVEEIAGGSSVLDIVQRHVLQPAHPSAAATAQLLHWLSGFKLVRCVSRSVEGLHSLLARVLKRAPAAKVPYLSFEMRSVQLAELVLAPAAPGQHSFDQHQKPPYLSLVRGPYTSSMGERELSSLLYRDNIFLKHGDRKRLQMELDYKASEQQEMEVEGMVPDLKLGGIINVGRRDHVVFSMNAKTFGDCCSSFKRLMPQLTDASPTENLSRVQLVHVPPSVVHGEEDLDIEQEQGESQPLPQQQHAFFQVLGGNLNRHKFVGQKPLAFDATVQLYTAAKPASNRADDTCGVVFQSQETVDSVDLQPTGLPLAAKFKSVAADELSSLCVWKLENEVSMVMANENVLIQEGGCIHYFQSNAYYKALLGLPLHLAVRLRPDMSAAAYKKELRKDSAAGMSDRGPVKQLPAPPPGQFDDDEAAGSAAISAWAQMKQLPELPAPPGRRRQRRDPGTGTNAKTCKSEPFEPGPGLLESSGAISVQDSDSEYAMTSPLDDGRDGNGLNEKSEPVEQAAEVVAEGFVADDASASASGVARGSIPVPDNDVNPSDAVAPVDALPAPAHQRAESPADQAASDPESPADEAASDPESPADEAASDPESPADEAASDPESPADEAASDPESPADEAASDPESPAHSATSDDRDNMTLADLQLEARAQRANNIVPALTALTDQPSERIVILRLKWWILQGQADNCCDS
eukprot:s3181_g3.t1